MADIFGANYTGKTNADLGLTQELQTSPSAGIYTTILSATDKYKIDLYESMRTYRCEDTPILQILLNLGDETATAPVYIWNDEFEGVGWWDISLDTLRQRNNRSGAGTITVPTSGFGATFLGAEQPFAIGNPNDIGGMLSLLPVTGLGDFAFTGSSTPTAITTISNFPTIPSNNFTYGQAFAPSDGEAGVAWFAFKKENDNTVGQIEKVYEKVRVLLAMLGYSFTDISHGGSKKGEILCSNSSKLPAEMAFPEIHVATGSGNDVSQYLIESFYNVTARIKYVVCSYTANGSEMYLMFGIDFNTSNAGISLGVYNASSGSENYDSVCISIPYPNGTPADAYTMFRQGSKPTHIGRILRLVRIGEATSPAIPNPEGDKFKQAGNLFTSQERSMNFCQIFRSDAYGVTGTHQASSFRMADTFIQTREFHFSIYKKKMNKTFLEGKKFEGRAAVTGNAFVTGQPVRATGGLFDYALFPISYIKCALPNIGWSQNMNGEDYLITWIDKLVDSMTSYRTEKGSGMITFAISSFFAKRLNTYVRQYLANTRLTGGQITYSEKSVIDMGLSVFDYKSSTGVPVKFFVDPALDNSMITVPYAVFGVSQLNSRDVLLSIDSKNIKRKVLRGDKIEGNIQDNGQDAFMEGIIGECGFMLRNPQNHTVVYAPVE